MIWLVPFLWILLLKTIDRPIGRNSFSQEPETGPDGSDGGGPTGFYSFFHGSGSASDGGYSGSDSGGYDNHGYDSGGSGNSGGSGDGGD